MMIEAFIFWALPYLAVIGFIIYLQRKNRREREANGPKPYEPSVVDRSFIEAAAAGRQRLDPATRELSAILHRWRATEAPEAVEEDYDPVAVTLLPEVRAGRPADALARHLELLMWQTFQVRPENTLGITNYITNWWASRGGSPTP